MKSITFNSAKFVPSAFKTSNAGLVIPPSPKTGYSSKAFKIGLFFQSGTNTDISHMLQVNGGYSTSPWGEDRVVGSILKIDNVVLDYDYVK